jgi:hypothetical protein
MKQQSQKPTVFSWSHRGHRWIPSEECFVITSMDSCNPRLFWNLVPLESMVVHRLLYMCLLVFFFSSFFCILFSFLSFFCILLFSFFFFYSFFPFFFSFFLLLGDSTYWPPSLYSLMRIIGCSMSVIPHAGKILLEILIVDSHWELDIVQLLKHICIFGQDLVNYIRPMPIWRPFSISRVLGSQW